MANPNVTYDQMQSAATRLVQRSERSADQAQRAALAGPAAGSERLFTTSRLGRLLDTAYQEFTQGATRTIQGTTHGRLPEQGRLWHPAQTGRTA